MEKMLDALSTCIGLITLVLLLIFFIKQNKKTILTLVIAVFYFLWGISSLIFTLLYQYSDFKLILSILLLIMGGFTFIFIYIARKEKPV